MATFDVQSLLGAFFEEAEEHLAAFEQGLLELERNPTDAEIIARIFRAAHSIKGASGTFGLDDVTGFTHALETLFDRLRKGEIAFEPALGHTLLESLDMLKTLVRAARDGSPCPPGMPALKDALLRFAPASTAVVVAQTLDLRETVATPRRVEVWFRPAPNFMSRGMDPIRVVRDLRSLGKVEECELDVSSLPSFEELDPTQITLAWRLVLTTHSPDEDIREMVSFVDDLCSLEIRELREIRLSQIPRPERSIVTSIRPGPTAVVAAPPPPVAAAGHAPVAESRTVRVATDKIDKLLDLVGELVIAHAMIVEASHDHGKDSATRMADVLSAMERHTRELQGRVMAIRMVPLATVFNRFPRLVHDSAASIGKKVRLDIQGEGTEIDKSMVEKLVDPLTHLVRNAIDHGLESPSDRLAQGKPEEGTITLAALHEGGNVVIEVSDDGRGLDSARIREKAERLGLITPDAVLTEDQLHDFIFHAGFSTAAKVSDISGRGVGMDVVKRNVELLNGSLTLSTVRGRGTKVRLRLPLTLAILDGLAVRIGSQTFMVPLLSVVECFRPLSSQVRCVFGQPAVIDVRGTSLPIVRMHEVLGVPDGEQEPTRALICIVESTAGHLALLVDEVLGQLQVVVKSLDVNFRKVDGLMGATIMGNGRVAMIVDVQALSRASTPALLEHDPRHAPVAEVA